MYNCVVLRHEPFALLMITRSQSLLRSEWKFSTLAARASPPGPTPQVQDWGLLQHSSDDPDLQPGVRTRAPNATFMQQTPRT